MTQTIINTKGHEDEIAQMYQQGVKLIDIADERAGIQPRATCQDEREHPD
uniref:Uncharacterized protein n=1 Tax=viral metagenome TaxID=1070528 RepID=A0A6M3KCC6_9ZZZZ